MAKKQESQSQSTEQKVSEQAKKLVTPENVELSKEEQAAVELIANPAAQKTYRLRDKSTQYTDPETGWTIAADQAKPLPKHVSAETLERIKCGFLVEGSGE